MSGPRAGVLVPPFAPVDRRASPLVVVIAIAALLQTTFLVSIDPSLAGFMPNHGHLYRNGVLIPHTHPWEAQRPAPPSSETACVTPPRSSGQDVVFTLSQDGFDGASIAVPLLAAEFGVACGPSVTFSQLAPTPLGVGDGVAPGVPTPPPRG